MPRTCTVCGHPELTRINYDLLSPTDSFRIIAGHYGLSSTALQRHKAKHLPVALSFARDSLKAEQAESVLELGKRLRTEALEILDRAKAAGQLETALKAIREVRGILELLAKLEGAIDDRGSNRPQRVEVVYIEKQLILNSSGDRPNRINEFTCSKEQVLTGARNERTIEA